MPCPAHCMFSALSHVRLFMGLCAHRPQAWPYDVLWCWVLPVCYCGSEGGVLLTLCLQRHLLTSGLGASAMTCCCVQWLPLLKSQHTLAARTDLGRCAGSLWPRICRCLAAPVARCRRGPDGILDWQCRGAYNIWHLSAAASPLVFIARRGSRDALLS
jgi:hypothetical protein